MAISIVLIAVLSAIFLYSCDHIESRVLITTWGVCLGKTNVTWLVIDFYDFFLLTKQNLPSLVILSFFAALGFSIVIGIKINISIAWTLPFIIL